VELYKNIDECIKKIKEDSGESVDLNIKEIYISKKRLVSLYLETITSSEQINNYVLKSIGKTIIDEENLNFKDIYKYFYNTIPSGSLKELNTFEDVYSFLYSGFEIILVEGTKKGIAFEMRASLDRGVSIPTSEAIVRGPKDGFTENFNKNLGLIRRRIKTPRLFAKEKKIGRKTKTRVGILYMDDIVDNSLVFEVNKRLDKIDIDAIIDSGYLRELIEKDSKSNFPTIMSTERPDRACMALLEGKIVIILDNSPFALIIPTFFVDYFHTPEDYYQKSSNISFIRIIRFFAFLISILTPAFYVAITTHNQSAIPSGFLLNFASQRQGVPFPGFVEALLMMIAFEILKESDTRSPSVGGSAISILGGIIIGDAAVSAGIVSPIMVIVISITAISSLVFSSIDVVNAIRVWRIIFLFSAATLGIYGIIILGIFFIIKLCSISSFGKPFTFPFAPFNLREQKDAIIRMSKDKLWNRNPLTAKKNLTRLKKMETGDNNWKRF